MSGYPLAALFDLDHGPGHRLLWATRAMGFSEAVARAGLRAELDAWREGQWPAPPWGEAERVLIIAARTLPVSAMRHVAVARRAGQRVHLRTASGQETLGWAIAAADPEVEVREFRSDDQEALDRAIAEVDAVAVLGSDATVQAVRARVPESKGFRGFGHALSAAWLGTLELDALRGLSRDLIAWDQAGCLSPQVAWSKAPVLEAIDKLASQVIRIEEQLPMLVSPERHQAHHTARALGTAMGGKVIITSNTHLVALPDPTFRPSPGFRTLYVLPMKGAKPQALGRHLACLGVSGRPPRGLDKRVRICRLGQMQRPPLSWIHR